MDRQLSNIPYLLKMSQDRQDKGDERERAANNVRIKTVRISWSRERVESLLEIAQELDPWLRGRDRENALRRQWLSKHPTLPSNGAALVQQLNRCRRLVAETGNGPILGPTANPPPQQPEPEEVQPPTVRQTQY